MTSGSNSTSSSGSLGLQWLGAPQALWLIGDIIAAGMAFYCAVLIRFGGDFSEAAASVGELLPRAVLFTALVLVGLFVTGMYRTRHRALPMQIALHSAVSVVIGGLLNILAYYVYPPSATGRGVLLVAIALAVVLITLARRVTGGRAGQLIHRRQVAVIGSGRAAQKIAMRRRRADQRRYEVVAYVQTPGDLDAEDGIELQNRLTDITDLYDLDIDEAVLALDERRGAVDAEVLFNLRQRGTTISTLVDFLEREAGRVDIDVADSAWFIFTQGSESRPTYLVLKRVVDLICASVLLLLLAPAMLLVSLLLYVESGFKHPALYRQTRVGLRGKPFELLKFRSMRLDAETDGPQWSSKNDDRVTRVGRVIRRLRLDELPQLVNVLRGQMSLVGPRPERPEFVRELAKQVPMYEYRHLVKPGLAGWAQLSFPYGESINDAREKLTYDLYYIKNASCTLDLFILAQTFEVVLWGEGVSMSGRNKAIDIDLPSARLPKWQPRGHGDSVR